MHAISALTKCFQIGLGLSRKKKKKKKMQTKATSPLLPRIERKTKRKSVPWSLALAHKHIHFRQHAIQLNADTRTCRRPEFVATSSHHSFSSSDLRSQTWRQSNNRFEVYFSEIPAVQSIAVLDYCGPCALSSIVRSSEQFWCMAPRAKLAFK